MAHDWSWEIQNIQKHSNWPAKLCNVVPPMWQAATPVLAVAKVLCGGSDPMILFSKKDFPVPEMSS